MSTRIETVNIDRGYLDYVEGATFVVDPRAQGFGLEEHTALDAYANKFFILSGEHGIYISPASIPDALLDYYAEVGIDVASPQNILTLDDMDNASPTERILHDSSANDVVSQRRGELLIPYMVSAAVEAFAERNGLQLPANASAVRSLANKAVFQEKLAAISSDIAEDTGFDLAVPTAPLFKAGDRSSVAEAYRELSHNGRDSVMVVRPESASALGVFMSHAELGVEGVHNILTEHFSEDEDVLLEEFVPHNHSPSMQGAWVGRSSSYKHLYFGRQIISYDGATISYESNEIPFGATTLVNHEDLERLQVAHKALGERLVQGGGIQGVAGFDAVLNVSPDGAILDAKMTEVNLHLPGSIAVYGAIAKLFPDGFRGVTRNWKPNLAPGQSHQAFMRDLGNLAIRKKGQYGLFPLNMSHSNAIDVIAFARDQAHLEQLLRAVNP